MEMGLRRNTQSIDVLGYNDFDTLIKFQVHLSFLMLLSLIITHCLCMCACLGGFPLHFLPYNFSSCIADSFSLPSFVYYLNFSITPKPFINIVSCYSYCNCNCYCVYYAYTIWMPVFNVVQSN